VSFFGSYDPCVRDDVFEGCDNIHHMCVPNGFEESLLCGRDDFCVTDSCESLHFESGRCSEESCFEGEIATRDRKNASDWQNRTNACVEYSCDEEKGPVMETVCLSTKEQRYVCENDGCLVMYSGTTVEIDLNNVYANDINTTELRAEIETLSGVSVMDVGLELEERGLVMRVVIPVNNNQNGQVIVDAVNNLDKEDKNCEFRTLCKTKIARLIKELIEVSESGSVHGNSFMFVSLLLVVVVLVVFK